MANFVQGVIDGVKTAFCTFINVGDRGTSFFNDISPLPDIPSAGPFWNRVLCNRNQPLPVPPSPFTGGQCPGVAYRIRYGSFRNGGPVNELGSSPKIFIGPVEFFDDSDEFATVQGIRGSQGESASVSISVSDSPAGFEVIDVERVDGQPDDCGDPPPPIPPFPPEGDTVNIDITYTNNEGDTVIELGDLQIFAPIVIAPVNIVAPIRVDLPDVSIDGQIVLAPRFDVNLNPPGPSVGPGEEGGDDEQPDPNDEKQLIGVRVITPNPDEGAATVVLGQGASPNLYVPRLATVQYEINFEGATTWTAPVDIKAANQFVPAPRDGLVVRFVISNIPNVSSIGRPVFIPEQPRCCV